ncbi:hypothetical protein AVEN_15338-1 [Araneus ventricosus]|uniref:Uncharacterized protein n=1 Tax=Araneus ventricosus TaxID=182803 RepID=A0A4Y2MD45_ARAVE|nr:hypothetical protein AVEN_15338-1 [Araneus ventricosus]
MTKQGISMTIRCLDNLSISDIRITKGIFSTSNWDHISGGHMLLPRGMRVVPSEHLLPKEQPSAKFQVSISSDLEDFVMSHVCFQFRGYLKEKVYTMKPAKVIELRAAVERECTQLPNETFRDVAIPLLSFVRSAWTRTDDKQVLTNQLIDVCRF